MYLAAALFAARTGRDSTCCSAHALCSHTNQRLLCSWSAKGPTKTDRDPHRWSESCCCSTRADLTPCQRRILLHPVHVVRVVMLWSQPRECATVWGNKRCKVLVRRQCWYVVFNCGPYLVIRLPCPPKSDIYKFNFCLCDLKHLLFSELFLQFLGF